MLLLISSLLDLQVSCLFYSKFYVIRNQIFISFFAMGREDDSAVVHSSIALLQERFRQLERAKEMRQEKELLQRVSESRHVCAASMPYVPSGSFVCSDLMMIQPRLALEFALYSEADIRIKYPQVQAAQRVSEETNKFDGSDVDTSLHL